MIFPFTLKIPANTTSDTLLAELKVPEGILTGIKLSIPAGWNFTAGIRFETRDGKVIPHETELERYFTGNDDLLNFTLAMKVPDGKMKIFGVNYDSNDHHLVGYLEILTDEEIKLMRFLNGGEVDDAV